jgi:5-methylcytosine-specific restriction endonuclease McrA
MAERNRVVAWHGFYTTARWQRLRKYQLIEHPLCVYCLANGRVTPATVVDHVVPHRGAGRRFVPASFSRCASPTTKSTKA